MFDDYGIQRPYGTRGMRFSSEEKKHILFAVGILTLAFAIVMTPVAEGQLGMDMVNAFLYSLGLSFVVIVAGFLFHELAHKFMAQKYGAWAEFRAYPIGLLIALVFAFLGFLFAAPGAVHISGRISKKQNGLISISGPATNLAVGAVFLASWVVIPAGDIVSFSLRWIGTLSLILAAFNLLPVPPLDGHKVLKWNPVVYVAVFGVTVFLALLGWGIISF